MMSRRQIKSPNERTVCAGLGSRVDWNIAQTNEMRRWVASERETPETPAATDRLYQLAAMTAGIFLLATVL